jgi:hypothetical protein
MNQQFPRKSIFDWSRRGTSGWILFPESPDKKCGKKPRPSMNNQNTLKDWRHYV